MSKIDCSKTLNYVSEMKRMCESYGYQCHGVPACPLANKACSQAKTITQEKIDIVQKWSDEHPQETMAEHFFKLFPNAPKKEDGSPVLCPQTLGFKRSPICNYDGCTDCWNRPYSEVIK